MGGAAGAAGAGRRDRANIVARSRRRRASLRAVARVRLAARRRGLQRDARGAMTETVVPTAEIGARLPETPFVGLVPYSDSDAQFFFGREGEKSIVKANLRASRLTVLYGPSGVGKSSLLLAGVVHDLRAQARRTAEEKPARAPAAVCVFRSWRDDSLPALMEAIHAAGTEALGDDQLTRWHLGDLPVETLHTWTERVRTFLVVLDQDRKSTRLNSSHVEISYAVFCLKKKKK